MMPRAKTPLIVRPKNPQVRAKRRALRSQEKKQPLRARMDPSKMLRVKQPVTIRQEKQLIPQARRAVRAQSEGDAPASDSASADEPSDTAADDATGIGDAGATESAGSGEAAASSVGVC